MDPEQNVIGQSSWGRSHVVGHNPEPAARCPGAPTSTGAASSLHPARTELVGSNPREPRPEPGALTLTGGAQGSLRGCRASSGDEHRPRLPPSLWPREFRALGLG